MTLIDSGLPWHSVFVLLPSLHGSFLLTAGFHLPRDFTINLEMFWRWLHITAGIIWIGLLYFFNLVNAPFLRALEPGTRSRILGPLMWRALNWFRWSSVVTVLAGLAYWGQIVSSDARNAGAHQGGLWGSWFLIWIVAWVIFYLCLRGVRNGLVVGILGFVVIILASVAFVWLNSHGWESNRTICIGIGGGMGFFLLLNVWGIIWRLNKRLLRWTEESVSTGAAMPPQAAEFARQSSVASRCGFFVTFPLIFFMAAASHYPMFGS